MDRTHAAALLAATLLGACGGPGGSGADAGSVQPDTGTLLPEYELKVGADFGACAGANVGNDTTWDPTGAVTVEDIVAVTYDAQRTSGGSASAAKTVVTRQGHSVTVTVDGSGTSAGNVPAQGVGQLEITGICATARNAKSFKVTWTCDGSFTTSGHSGALIQVSPDKCQKYRLIDVTGAVDEKDWSPKTHEEIISAVDGQACWLESADLSASATGGTANGAATVHAVFTLTVDPVY